MSGPRKTLHDRIAEEEKRQEDLRLSIAALKARARTLDRKWDVRRKIVMGAALEAHAKLNGAFHEAMAKALRAAVRPKDRELLPEFFPEPLPAPAPPARTAKSPAEPPPRPSPA